jgi:hypothetical protein
MFKEDEAGDLLIASNPAVAFGSSVVTGVAAAEIPVQSVDKPDPEPDPRTCVKTLRESLYEHEPWYLHLQGLAGTENLAPGIRRLMEKRVNRTLTTIADWMLDVVEERLGDEMTLVVLLELAEDVRRQVAWPELEAQKQARQ